MGDGRQCAVVFQAEKQQARRSRAGKEFGEFKDTERRTRVAEKYW